MGITENVIGTKVGLPTTTIQMTEDPFVNSNHENDNDRLEVSVERTMKRPGKSSADLACTTLYSQRAGERKMSLQQSEVVLIEKRRPTLDRTNMILIETHWKS